MADGVHDARRSDGPRSAANDPQALLLIATKLDQIAQVVAEIHQMVCPPETRDGEGLVEVLGRLANGIEGMGQTLAGVATGVADLEVRFSRIEATRSAVGSLS